ncbi:MAG: hypothetical protein H7331_06295 [Bacteroidia bacterium]|nr:hypothetical protein [Bacteroidia bacterium]
MRWATVLPLSSASGSRYGFNGQEKTSEIDNIGESNTYDFGARMYDSRLGRFLRTDPARSGFSFESAYTFAGNTTIWAIDKEGEKIYFVNSKGAVSELAEGGIKEAYDVLRQTTAIFRKPTDN